MADGAELPPSLARRLLEVGWAFLPLGWIAFGGPQSHIALLSFGAVAYYRIPAPAVIVGAGVLGGLFGILGLEGML